MAAEYLATIAVALTPHNTTVQPIMSAIYVGGGGNIKVKDKLGNTTTFIAVPTGMILPLSEVELIYATDTTATTLVGLR